MAQPNRKLLVWIEAFEARGGNELLVTFVDPESARRVTTVRFASREECQQWVEREAESLGVLVE